METDSTLIKQTSDRVSKKVCLDGNLFIEVYIDKRSYFVIIYCLFRQMVRYDHFEPREKNTFHLLVSGCGRCLRAGPSASATDGNSAPF